MHALGNEGRHLALDCAVSIVPNFIELLAPVEVLIPQSLTQDVLGNELVGGRTGVEISALRRRVLSLVLSTVQVVDATLGIAQVVLAGGDVGRDLEGLGFHERGESCLLGLFLLLHLPFAVLVRRKIEVQIPALLD